MTDVRDNIATVAHQAVQAMVNGDVEVRVDANRLRLAELDPRSRSDGGTPAGGIVSVELSGPDDRPYMTTRKITARDEATAWGIDEVVSAARRAAERILSDNPGWRRG